MSSVSAAWEREIQFYRRECDALGARLLRMQEEQSASHREARRSRTVAKLLREAYRLGDTTRFTHDLGMPVLELIVDNVLCDRAALLREEPAGSGRFLVSHAVGLTEEVVATVLEVEAPPEFMYTTEHEPVTAPADRIVAAIGVPYILWAYDRGSGLALVVGNRLETNVNRPFEAGDKILIEGALSVYADLIYRKHVELQLRQARWLAESETVARTERLNKAFGTIEQEFEKFEIACRRLNAELRGVEEAPHLRAGMDTMIGSLNDLRRVVRRTLGQASEASPPAVLDYEWVGIDELVRVALRAGYASNIRRGVEVDCLLPRRRVAICVDRLRMQNVIQDLIELATESCVAIGTVRVLVSRRSDGGLDLIVGGRQALSSHGVAPRGGLSVGSTVGLVAARIATARAVIEAHGGTMTLENSSSAGVFARAVFPPSSTRDIELAAL